MLHLFGVLVVGIFDMSAFIFSFHCLLTVKTRKSRIRLLSSMIHKHKEKFFKKCYLM